MSQESPQNTPRFFKLVPKALLALLVLSLLIEIPLLIQHARHGYFKIDGWFAFYAVLGILSCLVLAFLACGFGKVLRRDQSHYGLTEETTQPEDLDERIR